MNFHGIEILKLNTVRIPSAVHLYTSNWFIFFWVLQILKLEMPWCLSVHKGPGETMNWSNQVLSWWAASSTHIVPLLKGTVVAAAFSTSVLPVCCNSVLSCSAPSIPQLYSFLCITEWHFASWLPPAFSRNYFLYTWLCTAFQQFESNFPFKDINALNVIFHKTFCSSAFHWFVLTWWWSVALFSAFLTLTQSCHYSGADKNSNP